MSAKVKVELELNHGTRNYRVKSAVNTLDPKPGEIIGPKDAEAFIRRCSVTGGSVTGGAAKR